MSGVQGVRTRRVRQDDRTRERIRAAWLINRLQGHVAGTVELSPTQIRAAEILLRKCLPDLMQAEFHAEMKHAFVRLPEVMPQDLWLVRRGQPLVEGKAASPTYDSKLTPDAPTTLTRDPPDGDSKLN
jgi:hypothetical protein